MSCHIGNCLSALVHFIRSHDIFGEIDDTIPIYASPCGWGYLPTVELLKVASVSETSQDCDAVLGMVSQNAFRRPAHNTKQH